MENDILDSLNDLGYNGPLTDEAAFSKALDGGPKSLDYTKLVHILADELKKRCQLEETVNMMNDPDESSSFLLELSSFLKELGCPYRKLVTGHMSSRLQTKEDRLLLLDYLISELMAARIVQVDKPKENSGMKIIVHESPTAKDLKDILISLKFNKPPPNITPEMLFSKLEAKLKETIQKEGDQLVGKPLYNKSLSEKEWKQLEVTFNEMFEEYRLRRETLITRLECTIQSFEWSDRLKNKKDVIQSTYRPKREQLKVKPDVRLSDFLAARSALLQVEKTSSANVRKNTQSDVNKVIIGQVPDRGGRPNEQQPPPPEMPSWQQRSSGPQMKEIPTSMQIDLTVDQEEPDLEKNEVIRIGKKTGSKIQASRQELQVKRIRLATEEKGNTDCNSVVDVELTPELYTSQDILAIQESGETEISIPKVKLLVRNCKENESPLEKNKTRKISKKNRRKLRKRAARQETVAKRSRLEAKARTDCVLIENTEPTPRPSTSQVALTIHEMRETETSGAKSLDLPDLRKEMSNMTPNAKTLSKKLPCSKEMEQYIASMRDQVDELVKSEALQIKPNIDNIDAAATFTLEEPIPNTINLPKESTPPPSSLPKKRREKSFKDRRTYLLGSPKKLTAIHRSARLSENHVVSNASQSSINAERVKTKVKPKRPLTDKDRKQLHLRVVIVTVPSSQFSKAQAVQIMEAIDSRILATALSQCSSNAKAPSFRGKPSLVKGGLTMWCEDAYALNWLEKAVVAMKSPIPGTTLAVVRQSELNKEKNMLKARLVIHTRITNSATLHRVLCAQNPWYKVESWQCYNLTVQEPENEEKCALKLTPNQDILEMLLANNTAYLSRLADRRVNADDKRPPLWTSSLTEGGGGRGGERGGRGFRGGGGGGRGGERGGGGGRGGGRVQGSYNQGGNDNSRPQSNQRNYQTYEVPPGGYNQNQSGYNQSQGGYNQGQGGYNQGQGGYNQSQSSYNNSQSGYNQNQVGYNQNQRSYKSSQGGYNQNQGGYNQNSGSYGGGSYNNQSGYDSMGGYNQGGSGGGGYKTYTQGQNYNQSRGYQNEHDDRDRRGRGSYRGRR